MWQCIRKCEKKLIEEVRVHENPLPQTLNLWTIVQEFENAYYVYCVVGTESVALNS